MKPVLLVIDVQKAFYQESPVTAQSLTEAVQVINMAIGAFRKHNLPVICIQHMNKSENLLPGQPGFDTPDEMDVMPTDIHIYKTYGNSFNKTSLYQTIQDLGADTIFITGFSAAYCVLSTYRGAEDLDLKPILVRYGIASHDPRQIELVEELCSHLTPGALLRVLE
ncbi:MAG: isochorismatase family protein [Anaerolineae bacterium]|jgi:nicotinamidase-related amidase|nr:isochorismatase family protein [Anaerolineae bacterium]